MSLSLFCHWLVCWRSWAITIPTWVVQVTGEKTRLNRSPLPVYSMWQYDLLRLSLELLHLPWHKEITFFLSATVVVAWVDTNSANWGLFSKNLSNLALVESLWVNGHRPNETYSLWVTLTLQNPQVFSNRFNMCIWGSRSIEAFTRNGSQLCAKPLSLRCDLSSKIAFKAVLFWYTYHLACCKSLLSSEQPSFPCKELTFSIRQIILISDNCRALRSCPPARKVYLKFDNDSTSAIWVSNSRLTLNILRV